MSVSKSKLFAGALIVVLAVVGGVFYKTHHAKKAVVAPVQTKPVKTTPVPVKSEATATPQPVVESGYVIGVLSISKSVSAEVIQMKVTNDGDTTLTLTPDSQFQLVGLSDQKVRIPLAGKTTGGFKGALAPNDALSGGVTFDSFTYEDSELRFYPDPALPAYIVVPLIALPADQQ